MRFLFKNKIISYSISNKFILMTYSTHYNYSLIENGQNGRTKKCNQSKVVENYNSLFAFYFMFLFYVVYFYFNWRKISTSLLHFYNILIVITYYVCTWRYSWFWPFSYLSCAIKLCNVPIFNFFKQPILVNNIWNYNWNCVSSAIRAAR